MLKNFEVQRFSVYLTEDYGLLKFIWKASWAILMNKLFRITVNHLSCLVNPPVFNDHRFFCTTGSPESGILTERNSEGWQKIVIPSWEKIIKVIIRIEHIGLVWILKFSNPTRSKIFVKFGIEVIKKMTWCKKEVVCTCSL